MDPETIFRTSLSLCQTILSSKAKSTSTFVTREDIRLVVAEVSEMPTFASVDRARLTTELEERYTVYAPIHWTLGGGDEHIAWLPSKRGQISWRYWDRYVVYLQNRMPQAAIDSLDRVTDDVLSRLEDPERAGMWDRRGLVMGHVQSGKTASYCGMICKAADTGYRVIIVLAGVYNNLRSQTQIRLEEGFIGRMSLAPVPGGRDTFSRVGVGNIDPQVVADSGTNRFENGDFNAGVARKFGINPGGKRGNPLLFVVKKNATVLNNLLGWIRSCADGVDPRTERKFVAKVPLLVIDDEADLASIDTKQQEFDESGNPDLEHNPTTINGLIRKILHSFEKATYVGYTATPFANIFIHDRGTTREEGDDLFPRSFIVNIPPPSNYVGPARIFGISGEDEAGLEDVEPLPVVRLVTDCAQSDALDETRGWMPPKLIARTGHRPRYNGMNSIPPSLREAIMAFILVVAVRKLRESATHHNSMLVHVVRYTAVQKIVTEQVQSALRDILQRLQNGDGDRVPTIHDEFKALWDGESGFVITNKECQRIVSDRAAKGIVGERPVSDLPEWTDVSPLLREVTASIHVKTVNGSVGDVLDYEEHRDKGMNVIAIGGDKLSRGLTLEGLSVSYFLRASRLYDTLMQMGRWFGYRDGYVDVCRLYTTGELLEWFTHIASASEELQREFQYMCEVKGTPRDYGLKVRSHPLMLVTSAVKMRNGTVIRISFSGDISETIVFDRNSERINRNFLSTENWLSSLKTRPDNEGKPHGYIWKGVPASKVLEFLGVYSTYEQALRANTSLLASYIKAQLDHNELSQWTVLLCSSGKATARHEQIATLDVGLISRAPFPQQQQSKDHLKIRQLISPADELVDLTHEQKDAALKQTVTNWRNDPNRKPTDMPPNKPGRREAREFRLKSNGLLLLYPLDPSNYAGLSDGVRPIIGLGISFPKSESNRDVSYVVNNVYTLNGGDDESF